MNQDLIAQHIEELAQKQHIEGITRINEDQYQVTYSPQLTNSPYSHLAFTLTITIPDHYPEEPPSVAFADKIHHLNVDPLTGEITMPVLGDDWSPYLTLAAVFDSLDSLLEQPDIEYATNAQLRNQYLNKPELYKSKVEQIIKQGNELAVLNDSNSVVEHVEVIEESKSNEKALSNSCQESIDHTVFKNSQDLSDIPKIRTNVPRGLIRKSEEIKIETLSNPSSQQSPKPPLSSLPIDKKIQPKQLSQSSKRQLPPVPVSRQPPSSQLRMISSEQSRQVIKRNDNDQFSRNSEFDKVHLNLINADRMIQLLMEESKAMEQTLKRVGTGKLKEKLESKQQRILEMLEETLELSSSLREKLFARLKTDTKSLLG